MSDETTGITNLQDVVPVCSHEQRCDSPGCTSCAHLLTIQKLELEIAEIKRNRHWELVAYNQKYDPLINLPAEIVSLIFHFAIDYESGLVDGVTGFVMESARTYIRPIWLASVCTRWRRIALADPRLWSLIYIVYCAEGYPLSARRNWAPSIEHVRQWLSRSGALPLRITLIWNQAPDSEDETLREIIEALCEQCHRWQSLYIRVRGEALDHFLCAGSEFAIDLDHLCIDDHDEADRYPWSMGYTTLRPRHVALHSTPWVNGTLSWTHMISLRISMAIPGESLNVIMHANQLEDLHLRLVGAEPDRDVPALVTPVIAPRLRQMSIEFTYNEDLEEFFMSIQAPELETLDLNRYSHTEIHVPLDFLEPLLLRSGNKLLKLSTKGLAFSAEDLLILLSGLDHLSRLEITFGVNNDNTVSSLDPLLTRLSQTSTEHPVTFLPRLTHVIYRGPYTFTWSAIAEVMEAHSGASENPSERQLQLLSVWPDTATMEDYIDKETLIRLQALQPSEMTMRVSIDEDLIQTSFEHHGINAAPYPILFRLPL